ncbi:hypothetical protein DYI25_05615 [Mesobacillus boroniphilus]|uniref:Uncharacterized protein n=1 Tax=Mesobacillus boroniphilus TaxID=308892 RepID=A0A944CLD9_9BACI|nr:hypothetical protein [Mesobacillus boroniphilus]MBS8263913.1 hypothetical protein [Mesobacillus boroniphilus]
MQKVICINNEGLELEFKVGEKYDVDRELETTYIVTNELGKKHTVFKTQFGPVEESGAAI